VLNKLHTLTHHTDLCHHPCASVIRVQGILVCPAQQYPALIVHHDLTLPFRVTAACAHAENSNARLGADVRYRLLARAIDISTGIALAQAVSESFHVSFQLLWQGLKPLRLILVGVNIIIISTLLIGCVLAGLHDLTKVYAVTVRCSDGTVN